VSKSMLSPSLSSPASNFVEDRTQTEK